MTSIKYSRTTTSRGVCEMERLSFFLIALGLLLWARKELFSDNDSPQLDNGRREKIQQIDSRLYR